MNDTTNEVYEMMSAFGDVDIDTVLQQLFLRDAHSRKMCEKRFTHDELVVLHKRIKDGDIAAVHELAMSAIFYMVAIAGKYRGRVSHNVTLSDLYSTGYLGLVHAAEKYNPELGAFTTYATHWLHQYIHREFMKHDRLVYLPNYVLLEVSRYLRAFKAMRTKHERVTSAEVALNRGIDIAHAMRLEEYANAATLMVHHTGETGDEDASHAYVPVYEGDAPETKVDAVMRQQVIQGCLQKLTARERDIIERYYGFHQGEEETLEEIGRAYNITSQRVWNLRVVAVKKLTQMLIQKGVTIAE